MPDMWRYSGGGYTVMQLLLSDVVGQPFPQLMRELLLDPIGMRASTYQQPLPDARTTNAATGYRGDGSAGLFTRKDDEARVVEESFHAGQ